MKIVRTFKVDANAFNIKKQEQLQRYENAAFTNPLPLLYSFQ